MTAYKQKFGENQHTIVTGVTPRACAQSLSNFRTKKGIPKSTLKECEIDVANYGFQHKLKTEEKSAQKPKKLTVANVLSGSKALFSIVRGDIVSDQEIKERAAICAACPLISDTSDRCTGCTSNKLFKYARDIAVKYGRNFFIPTVTVNHLRPRKTAKISEFYCGHCGCSCLNLVLSKSKHFLEKETSKRPANCWVHNK